MRDHARPKLAVSSEGLTFSRRVASRRAYFLRLDGGFRKSARRAGQAGLFSLCPSACGGGRRRHFANNIDRFMLPDSDARLHALYTASFSTAPPTIYVK